MLPVDTLLLVSDARQGDAPAAAALYAAVYEELRRLARRARHGPGPETLNTTAIVHEAYLKLAGSEGSFDDRAHFLGVAAKAMRCVVVDHVRRGAAEKRGGAGRPATLRETLVGAGADDDVLALDESLQRFAAVDPRAARIVECRFFGGLSVEETAAVVGVSAPTVTRAWRAARLWLYRDLHGA